MKKIDKNKVYAFIGRAVVYGAIYISAIVFSVWSFTQITVY